MLKNYQNVKKNAKKIFCKKFFFEIFFDPFSFFFQNYFFQIFFSEMKSATQKTPETEKSFQSVSIWSNNKQKKSQKKLDIFFSSNFRKKFQVGIFSS